MCFAVKTAKCELVFYNRLLSRDVRVEKVQIRLNLAVSLFFAQIAFMTGINAMRYTVKYMQLSRYFRHHINSQHYLIHASKSILILILSCLSCTLVVVVSCEVVYAYCFLLDFPIILVALVLFAKCNFCYC